MSNEFVIIGPMKIGAVAGILIATLLFAGCPSNEPEFGSVEPAPSEAVPPDPQDFRSSVHMADPSAEPQLLEGFYGVEQGAWRWTARKFVAALKPPPAAASAATELELKFTIPEVVTTTLGAITLTARVNGVEIGRESYDHHGEQTFVKPVPASAMQQDTAKVEFELDKALPPGATDQRELGLVASSIALK